MDLDHDVPLEGDLSFSWTAPDFDDAAWRLPSDEPCWPRFDLFPRLSRLLPWSRHRG